MGMTANVYRQTDFSGGLNARSAPHLLHESELIGCEDLTFSEYRGMPKVRHGYTKFNTTPIDANPIHGLVRYYKRNGNKYLITTSGTKIYQASGTTLNASTLASGLASNSDWSFATLADTLLSVGYPNPTKRYNGTTMRNAGFPGPASGPTSLSGGAGVLTGIFSHGYSYVYDNAAEESSISPVSNDLTVLNGAINLSGISIGGAGCTARNIYRTEASGSTYYFVAEIADNSTTTYVDNNADTTLTLSEQAPDDNTAPPAAKYIAVYANRAWYANVSSAGITYPSRLYFSALTESETSPNTTGTAPVHGAGGEIVPSDFWIDINDDDGDVITGLGVLLDSLVIFKEKSLWRIIGDSPDNFSLMKVESDIGCVAPRSIAKVESMLYFLTGGDRPTVAATDGIRVVPIGERIQPLLTDTMIREDMPLACAVRYKYNYFLFFYKSNEVQTPFDQLEGVVYDYIKDSWGELNGYYATVFSIWDGSSDNGECYMGSSFDGTLFRFDNGNDDIGNGIGPLMQTKWYDFKKPDTTKIIKRVVFLVAPCTANITVQILRDFSLTAATGESEVFTAPAAEPADGEVAVLRLEPPDTCQGRYFSFHVSGDEVTDDDFRIYGMAIYYDEQEDDV